MKRIVILLAMCEILLSCSTESEAPAQENSLPFNKLLGTWKLSDDNQYEQWKKNSDGSYISQMFAVKGTDTTVMEDVKIVSDAGKWNFITQVKGQNSGKAITFTSTILGDTLVQFENPAHDFPRIINYRIISGTNMQAFIGGTTDTIYFNFSRVSGK